MDEILITAYGGVTRAELVACRHGLARRTRGRCEPMAMRWRTVSDVPFDRWGRLDALSRYAVAAVEMLGLAPLGEDEFRPRTAIVLGTCVGCFGADVAFWRGAAGPDGASPMVFPYTLPSTAIGEIAIRHRITGPNLCIAAGEDSGWLAVWEGMQLVRSGEADGCVCIACDAVPEGLEPDFPSAAHALLVETAACASAPLASARFQPVAAPPAHAMPALASFLTAPGPAAELVLPAPATLGAPATAGAPTIAGVAQSLTVTRTAWSCNGPAR